MKNFSFPIPAGLLHVEQFLIVDETHWAAMLRLFREPLGMIDPQTAQPMAPYDWVCTLHQDGGSLWVKGVMDLPPMPVVLSIIRMARELPGAREVCWSWLDEEGWQVNRIQLYRDNLRRNNSIRNGDNPRLAQTDYCRT